MTPDHIQNLELLKIKIWPSAWPCQALYDVFLYKHHGLKAMMSKYGYLKGLKLE